MAGTNAASVVIRTATLNGRANRWSGPYGVSRRANSAAIVVPALMGIGRVAVGQAHAHQRPPRQHQAAVNQHPPDTHHRWWPSTR